MSSDPDSELILSANCDKSQDIWIGTAGAIMFTDDSWMLPKNNFETTKDGVANFKGTYIDTKNDGNSFGGFVICDYIENDDTEQDN